MPKIFISYRHDDSSYATGEIARRLASVFGKKSVVLDVDNILPGQDFRDSIKHHLEACDLLIAVIGKSWLLARDQSGQARLDNPADWVRIELETALSRESKIPVIPVLLDNVPPLKAEQLPESLKELAFRQAHSVRPPTDFDHDVDKLIQKIKSQKMAASRWPLILGSSAMIATVVVLITILLLHKPNAAALETPPPNNAANVVSAPTEKRPPASPPIQQTEQAPTEKPAVTVLAEATAPTLKFQKLTSADGKFTVEMPGKPTDKATDISGWKRHEFSVSAVENGKIYRYVVNYMDLSGVKLNDPQRLIKLFQSGNREGQKIVEERAISVGTLKIPGREYKIDAGGDVVVREWMLLDGARLYNLFVATNDKAFVSSKDADRLFDSFQITK